MRLFGWFSRRRRYEELAESIQEHLDEKVEELIGAGLSCEEATYAARREFGNRIRIEERSREVWQWPQFESIWSDLKFALRQLRKSPGFATTVVLTLALGIGANTAIFSTMDAVLMRTLPVRDPQQLFYLTHAEQPNSVGDTGDADKTFGINVYDRMRRDKRIFSDVIAFVPLGIGKTPARFGNAPEEIQADEVSGNFFSALGVHMAAGVPFEPADEEQHSAVTVLSYGYWTRRLNRDPGVLGKTIYLNGAPMTVIGVAGSHFNGVESGGVATDLWVPLQTRPELPAWGIPPSPQTIWNAPNWWALMLIARLRPGVSIQEAVAYEDPLFQRATWETVGKDVNRNKQPLTLTLVPARGLGTATSDYEEPLHVQMGMVALVLLIACINIAMLLTARNAAREREFSVRLALGAGRWPHSSGN
jgi:predicted permease